MAKKAQKKPGPKESVYGKKVQKGIALAEKLHEVLDELAQLENVSASQWIEVRIIREAKKHELL